jgi:hypothetical protein
MAVIFSVSKPIETTCETTCSQTVWINQDNEPGDEGEDVVIKGIIEVYLRDICEMECGRAHLPWGSHCGVPFSAEQSRAVNLHSLVS